MPADKWVTILTHLTFIALAVEAMSNSVNGDMQKYLYYKGRHVCSQPHQVNRKVETMQTYCKPKYRQVMRRCGYRFCPTFQLIYEIAYRKSYRMVQSMQTMYTCCPGWTRYSIRENSCMTPRCSKPCENGGTCILPEKCSCPNGLTGSNCAEDVDECSKDHGKCEQKCVNTHGSFKCSCYHGYQIQPDGKTCKLFIQALPEYRELNRKYNQLRQQLEVMETDMKLTPAPNMTQLFEEFQRTMALESHQKYADDDTTTAETTTSQPETTTSPPKTTTPPQLTLLTRAPPITESVPRHPDYSNDQDDRLASLSDQIGLLEERLDDCACRSHSAIFRSEQERIKYIRGRRRRERTRP